MKKELAFLFLCASVSGCAGLLSSEADWNFVQGVGGIKIGSPTHEAGSLSKKWYLPVYANVSGTEKITVEPTMLNSGNECSYVSKVVKGNSIFLQIHTSVIGFVSNSARCPNLYLGALEEGTYEVYYGKKGEKSNRLGVIVIKL